MEELNYVIKNIKERFTRSSLTVISILIGIAAIFAIISFGQGLNSYINTIASEAGTDTLIVQPKGAGAPGSSGNALTDEDFEFIRGDRLVKQATPSMMRQTEVKEDEDERGKWVYVMGFTGEDEDWKLVERSFGGYGLAKGRYLEEDETGKAIVGHNYQLSNKVFEDPLEIGDRIYIKNTTLEIVGFYEKIGSPDDNNVYLTNEQMERIFDVENEYEFIYVRAREGVEPSMLSDRLTEGLRKEKGLEEGQEDFFVQTFEELLETYGSILTTLNWVLVFIAGISILVAAVNVTNTMYTAVLERTKEIGIMKAIGAQNDYILKVFFYESGILGLIGGILGIALGYGIAKTGGMIAQAAGYGLLQPAFPWWLIVGCLLFAFCIGAGGGSIPAYNASKLKPVDSIRYE